MTGWNPVLTSGVNTSTTSIITAIVPSLILSLFGVGSPMAILMAGSSIGHYVAAGLTLIAGIGASAAPIVGLIKHNQANSSSTIDVINTLSNVAGQVANNINASRPSTP